MTTRQRSPRGHGADLRDEILEAAERLLIDNGSDESVSVRAVASAVGVTPPSLYRHFADKDELIAAVCEKQFAAFHSVMNEAVKDTTSPLENIRAQGEAYINFGLAHPETYVVMFMRPPSSFARRKAQSDDIPPAFLSLVKAVERAMQAGVFRRGDANHAAQVIWATVHGLTSLLIAQPDFAWSDREALVNDTLHAAVAPFLHS